MTNFPSPIQSAITNALHQAQQDGGVFDAYSAAIKICETFLDGPVSIDSVIDAMIAKLGCIQAVEISPPAMMIDVVFSVDDDDDEIICDEMRSGSTIQDLVAA